MDFWFGPSRVEGGKEEEAIFLASKFEEPRAPEGVRLVSERGKGEQILKVLFQKDIREKRGVWFRGLKVGFSFVFEKLGVVSFGLAWS